MFWDLLNSSECFLTHFKFFEILWILLNSFEFVCNILNFLEFFCIPLNSFVFCFLFPSIILKYLYFLNTKLKTLVGVLPSNTQDNVRESRADQNVSRKYIYNLVVMFEPMMHVCRFTFTLTRDIWCIARCKMQEVRRYLKARLDQRSELFTIHLSMTNLSLTQWSNYIQPRHCKVALSTRTSDHASISPGIN